MEINFSRTLRFLNDETPRLFFFRRCTSEEKKAKHNNNNFI